MIDQALLDLRITTNPHLKEDDQKKMLTDLLDKRRELWGPDLHGPEFDKEAFDLLKQQLKNASKTIKVK